MTSDVMATSVPEVLVMMAMFRSDYLITSNDERIGWQMFLDRFGYPWRDDDCDLETVDAGW